MLSIKAELCDFNEKYFTDLAKWCTLAKVCQELGHDNRYSQETINFIDIFFENYTKCQEKNY